jgi:4-hydroxythreonine-4-phosphate dehydrogenase
MGQSAEALEDDTASRRPILGVTLGDASGIGPEIVARLLAREETYALARPLVFGDAEILARGAEVAGITLRPRPVASAEEARFVPGEPDLVDRGILTRDAARYGEVSVEIGRASAEYTRLAAEAALRREIQGLVSGPVSKEALHLAVPGVASDADYLARLTGAARVQGMIGVGGLRVFTVTQHVALARVSALVTRERVLGVIRTAASALPSMGVERPRIAVAGLNPHAGDGGLFGLEEIQEIAPAVADARLEGIDVLGPFPDDTVFVRCHRGDFDAVVAMFHAQANVAVKMVGFGRGVSVTIGLPFPRATTAHGVGLDIAGTGQASAGSLIDAYELVANMARAG